MNDKIKILLIDDDYLYIECIKNHELNEKYDIKIISDLKNMNYNELEKYSCIIVDHSLECGDSFEIIELLKNHTKASFIIVSTYSPNDYSKQYLENPNISEWFEKKDWEKMEKYISEWVVEKSFILEELNY